jgi:hypothetical protein
MIANRQDVAVEAALQGLGIIYVYDNEGLTLSLLRKPAPFLARASRIY